MRRRQNFGVKSVRTAEEWAQLHKFVEPKKKKTKEGRREDKKKKDEKGKKTCSRKKGIQVEGEDEADEAKEGT